MASLLYISYDGMLEPLGESQVLAYLRGLAADHPIVLLSFEKPADLRNGPERERISQQLRAARIRWIPLRYHKAPSLLATAFDVAAGVFVGRFLAWRHRVQIVHARSYVPALIGWTLRRTTRLRFVFDMRGLWADERVDAQVWKTGSWLYRLSKTLERRFLREADVVISLTEAAVPTIRELAAGGARDLRIEVIPTCVDLERFFPSPAAPKDLLVGCVGSVGAWGCLDVVAASFTTLRRLAPRAALLVLNRGEHRWIHECLARHGISADWVAVREVPFASMPAELRKMAVGLVFYRPGRSQVARAPTKLGELLASGVPCLTNGGIGDVDRILAGEGVGVVMQGQDAKAHDIACRAVLALAADPAVGDRCRRVAERYFSLQAGTRKYAHIYAGLTP